MGGGLWLERENRGPVGKLALPTPAPRSCALRRRRANDPRTRPIRPGFEHVLPLKLAVDTVLEDPSRALEVADQVTTCIVTSDEAKRLGRSTASGWDRYRDTRAPVVDVSKQADDPEYWIVRPESF